MMIATLVAVVSMGAEGGSSEAPERQAISDNSVSADPQTPLLEKQKLEAEIRELEIRNVWWRTYMPAIPALSSLGALVVFVVGLVRWRVDLLTEQQRREEALLNAQRKQDEDRAKRDEDRFQAVVAGLGSQDKERRTGAAIMLRTFFAADYKRFHQQAFDAVVGSLRMEQSCEMDALRYALMKAFTEIFPTYRGTVESEGRNEFETKGSRRGLNVSAQQRHLDASGIWLVGGFLWKADLRDVFMAQACLRDSDFSEANLSGAVLWGKPRKQWAAGESCSTADLRHVQLSQAILEDADLGDADLTGAVLHGAKFLRAKLWGAKLVEAKLPRAILTDAVASKADLSGADLGGAQMQNTILMSAKLCGADLSGAKLPGAVLIEADLTGAKLIGADLTGADLTGADLTGANLWQAVLEQAKYNTQPKGSVPPTKWPAGPFPPPEAVDLSERN